MVMRCLKEVRFHMATMAEIPGLVSLKHTRHVHLQMLTIRLAGGIEDCDSGMAKPCEGFSLSPSHLHMHTYSLP